MTAKMPSFADLTTEKSTVAEITQDLDHPAVVALTDQIYATIKEVVAGTSDAEVVFVPADADIKEDETGWTLAHIISHVTATCEEGAASASALARGVTVTERSRYEMPWEELTTAEQLHARVEESHRMCAAFLHTWPDKPHLDITQMMVPRFGPLNAISRYMLSLMHANGHIEQIQETVRQARGVGA